MNEEPKSLADLIDRLGQGDDDARRLLLEHALDHLRRLTGAMLRQSFPVLHNRHEVDSIVHDAWLRLFQALEKVRPPTVADFLRLAAHKIRQVLLDLADRQRRLIAREGVRLGDLSSQQLPAERNDTLNPVRLAEWTEFHEQVADLPESERTVFELHHYLGMPQAEIARVLELHPRKVSYLWIAATERLAGPLDPGNSSRDG